MMPEAKYKFDRLISGYKFTNNIPKYKLYVKLDPMIS